jgi:hypothetical protein
MSLGRRKEAALICREPLATCEHEQRIATANRNMPDGSVKQQQPTSNGPKVTTERQRPQSTDRKNGNE